MTSNANPSSRPRIQVNQPAVLRNGDATGIACTIVDISGEGFRIQIPRGFPCGANYSLEFDQEIHPVEIRWVSPGEAGGLFLDVDGRA